MKRSSTIFLLLCAIVGLSNHVIYAQKLYLLTGGDLQDKELGSAIEESVFQVTSSIEANMPPKYLIRYNDPENSWNGPDIYQSQNARRDILAAIDRCPAGPNDTIFFYWCGHGAYDVQNGEKKHYLLVPNAGEKSVMYRSEILGALKKKRPRLAVLITDSCNSFRKVTLESTSRAFEPAMAPTEPMGPGIPLSYISLFFQCRGTVDVNSSDWNQKAAIWENGGSVFSSELSSSLMSPPNKPETWEVFLQQINRSLDQGTEVSGELGENEETEERAQSLRIWSLPKPDNSVRIPKQDISQIISDTGEESTGGSAVAVSAHSYGNGHLSADVYDWSAPAYHPENGDRIIEVNGTAIQNTAEFREAVRNSDSDVLLTLIGNRSGNPYYMRTTLLPRGSRSRLGINVQDDDGDGVVVTGVMANMPGNQCRYLQDGNVRPVRSQENVIGRNGSSNGRFPSNLLVDYEDNSIGRTGPMSWSAPLYHPERGDRIVEVNGILIRNTAEFNNVIRESDNEVILTFIGNRTGDPYYMKTTLLPQGSRSRLGIYVQDDNGNGVTVTNVMSNMPGNRCRYLQDGNVQPVRNQENVIDPVF